MQIPQMMTRLPTNELNIEQYSHKSTVLSSNRFNNSGHSSMLSRYNFRQLITSPSQVTELGQQQQIFVMPSGGVQKGYQILDSNFLRTDEDESNSQT